MKKEVRKINRQHWDQYIVDLEYDMHRNQYRAYKIIKELNNAEKDTVCLIPIPLHQWEQYYRELWTIKEK
jgi:predicted Zn-dependent protease